MKPLVQFASLLDEKTSSSLFDLLAKQGYEVRPVSSSIQPDELVLCLFGESAKAEDFLSLPWLKEQSDYSSYRYLRVLPFFVYRSSETDPEEAFENGLGDEVEEVFSGEFKPFGFDLDDVDFSLKELDRIIEESYLE